MDGKEPSELNWLQVRILSRLNDRGHAVLLRDLSELVKDMSGSIICTTRDMAEDGLVSLHEPPGLYDKLVTITPLGKSILLKILQGPSGCD